MEPARTSKPPPPPLPHLQVRYCGIHGLVIGPDGRCVICKRDRAEPEEQGSRRAVVAAGLGLATAVGVFLIYKGLTGAPPPPPRPFQPVAAASHAVVSAPLSDDPEYVAREQAKGEAAEEAAVEKQQALEEAMRRVKVKVYTKDACDLCRDATKYLADQGVAFTELDVDTDASALAALRALPPGGAAGGPAPQADAGAQPMVPTFEVDGEVVVGFGPREMGAALARAAQRRLR